MSVPVSVNPLIKQVEYEGCRVYESDIRGVRDSRVDPGTLTVKGQPITIGAWNKTQRDNHIKEFESRSRKIGVFGIATIITGIATFILAFIFPAVGAPLGIVSLLSAGGMLYNAVKFNKDKTGFRRQAAVAAQFYLSLGPIKAMKRKWELGRLNGIEGVDLLQSNESIRKELEEAMRPIETPVEASNPRNTEKLAKLLAPQQALFEQLKKAPIVPGAVDPLTDVVVKWFQGNRQDPQVILYCQMKDLD